MIMQTLPFLSTLSPSLWWKALNNQEDTCKRVINSEGHLGRGLYVHVHVWQSQTELNYSVGYFEIDTLSAELSLTAGLIHVWQSRVDIKHYSIIIQAQDCNVSRREADLI